ncbi:hypothetical protein HYQ45_015061 [Verticillium longisporum]|uniref:Uncharacterized protein n=2 Tax=Verticillium TaxID=1036719 RepID=A0A8I2Z9L6_VERLO|nr:hypothetical protein HYQ44_008035 [Verticillium longisporum]KAG7119430.1 hypothetical protein HYQ45_015061 [Verticillium longisporum]RXG48730.1 hypothetical protein VDGE_30019 [Verticillium dahliae]
MLNLGCHYRLVLHPILLVTPQPIRRFLVQNGFTRTHRGDQDFMCQSLVVSEAHNPPPPTTFDSSCKHAFKRQNGSA